MFTEWTPDKQHRHLVNNVTHLNLVPPRVTAFTCTGHQYMVPTWHQLMWLGRGVEAAVMVAKKDMANTIFNPEEPGAGSTYKFDPVFLSRSNPHIAHLLVGEGQVVLRQGPYQLQIRKTGATDADATVHLTLGGFLLPTRLATACMRIAYKGCGESLEGLDPTRIDRMRFTLLYKGCGESLRGVDPSRLHHMRSRVLYKGCGESLESVEPSWIHRMRPTLVYRDCGETLEGVHPSRIHRMTPILY